MLFAPHSIIVREWNALIILCCPGFVRKHSIDPMISFATVPNYQQMRKGGLVGTVKIISYAVDAEKLRSACALGSAAIKILPPQLKTASLVVSQNANRNDDKGISAIKTRLDALGITLEQVVTTEHEIDPMAKALGSLKSELLLILTSSATSDLMIPRPLQCALLVAKLNDLEFRSIPGICCFWGVFNPGR